jgi:hypothetical protein
LLLLFEVSSQLGSLGLPAVVAELMGVRHHHLVPMVALLNLVPAVLAPADVLCLRILDLARVAPLRNFIQPLVVKVDAGDQERLTAQVAELVHLLVRLLWVRVLGTCREEFERGGEVA